MQIQPEHVERAAKAAEVGGSVMAGASGTVQFLGLNHDQWAIVGIVAGIGIAAAGYLTGLVFQYLNYRLNRRTKVRQ